MRPQPVTRFYKARSRNWSTANPISDAAGKTL
jgi:hypothetical protein